MKKLGFLIAIVSMMLLFTVSTNALEISGQCGDNTMYVFDENSKTLTISGEGAIDDYAFSAYSNSDTMRNEVALNVSTVIINECITEIGKYAFDCCRCTSISLPNSLKAIRKGAFYCARINNIVVPDSVEIIESAVFNSCQNLVDVKLSNNINVIEELTFSGCDSLEYIAIPNSVIEIKENAFSGCCSPDLVLNIPCNIELEYVRTGILGSLGYKNSFCGTINIVPNSKQEHYFRENYFNEISTNKFSFNTILVHSFSASYEEDGKYVMICSGCGQKELVSCHNLVKHNKINATCTQYGTKEYWQCTICNCCFADYEAAELINDIDIWKIISLEEHCYYWYHTDSMGKNAYDLLCSECGENFGRGYLYDDYYYMYRYEENIGSCHNYYNEKAEKLGEELCEASNWITDETYHKGYCKCHRIICEDELHSYTSTITKEATCWREGEKTYTCTCGESYTEAIAKLDHEYRPWETKKNPTCTAPGLEWSYCLICDNDFEREIPATGHTIIDYTRRATPDSDGAYVTACDVCNEVFKSISFGRPTEYKLSTTKYTYDGKTKTPKLTVETSDGVVLKEGVDYELELPSGRKAVGVYTYRVVFKGNFLGEKKVSYQILPGKTSKITATQSTSSIKLTWKKVTGADGYRVYQYNSKTGKYEKIKTLTGTSYTVKKLKAGTTYKFAVKAYTKDNGETLWAASSVSIKTATKPATPTVKATANNNKVTLKWSKVTGATGYVVYMQDEFGDYKKIGSTKKTSYSVKNLEYGETCRFRVVAYKKVDGKNIYGGYKTVKITVPYPAIYVTPTGKRYHFDKECAGKNATKTTLANAQKTKTPCKTCVL